MRLADAIQQGAFAEGKAPMLDPQYGGMHGFAPNLKEWVNNQKYVSRQVIALLLEAPQGFNLLPNGFKYTNALKAWIETHSRSITGLNSTLTVAVAESPVGGANEMHQDPTNVTQERTIPNHQGHDLYGRPFQNLHEFWIRQLIMNQNSKTPEIAALQGGGPTDMLADMYAATVLYYEPDPSFTSVEKAWLITNFYPLSGGDNTGRRDLTQDGELLDLNITYSGVTQQGAGVINFAAAMHDQLIKANANPYMRESFLDGVSADVASAFGGYQQGVETLANEALIQAA